MTSELSLTNFGVGGNPLHDEDADCLSDGRDLLLPPAPVVDRLQPFVGNANLKRSQVVVPSHAPKLPLEALPMVNNNPIADMPASFIICGWFTPSYKHYADTLIANLDGHRLPHDIVEVMPITGTWEKITMAKPDQVLAAMRRHPDKVIIFLDVDCIVVDAAKVADMVNLAGDISFMLRGRFRRQGGVKFMPRSGTMVIKPTASAKAFIEAWRAISMSAASGYVDQDSLGVAMGYVPGCTFTALDQRYCTCDYDGLPNPWILHTSGSRSHKTPHWKRIAGRYLDRLTRWRREVAERGVTLRWNNGVLRIGWLFSVDAFGVELAWGRCDRLGIVEPYGPFYADRKTWVLASGLDYLQSRHSLPRAVLARFARWVGGRREAGV